MTDSAIGPDSLMMAIALGGRPEDSAKMVWSCGCIAYFFQQIGKGNAASISQAISQYAAVQHDRISLLPPRSNHAALAPAWVTPVRQKYKLYHTVV
ncbi:hypothetical protein [Bradyrhizobium septentrionale]|uniref:Uncharacterized protein n=2 Tax=Bradyrhizobium septentrionale TaxID=1404411 RepID=A0ABZ2NYV2_9BRAD|nr:hypothetical protein [Bradyrhizobium septentrionale]UGY18699.1 hypothetical protein HAP48_0015325 [Bradyrhizobium septentrionale]UGY27411.1 hypothetical protein HU675_0011960 [Bradyrhizobium septentrionale]